VTGRWPRRHTGAALVAAAPGLRRGALGMRSFAAACGENQLVPAPCSPKRCRRFRGQPRAGGTAGPRPGVLPVADRQPRPGAVRCGSPNSVIYRRLVNGWIFTQTIHSTVCAPDGCSSTPRGRLERGELAIYALGPGRPGLRLALTGAGGARAGGDAQVHDDYQTLRRLSTESPFVSSPRG